MRVHISAVVSAVLLSSMLTAEAAHGECLKIPIQDFLSKHADSILLKGSVSSVTEISDPEGGLRLKYTFDVERVWKGSVGKRIELYAGLSGNEPQLGAGPFFATLLGDSTRRRLGITGTDTLGYVTVMCSDVYAESEIKAAFGPGKEPSKDAGCVRDPRVVLHKVRDRKAEQSDLRDTHTHGGVLIFEIRVDTSGQVTDVRLAKAVDQQPPWPTLAERWRNAISDWRYEPPALDHKPVAVCLTVTVRQEVM